MTTRLRSLTSTKGVPVNYCSGFRSLNVASAHEVDGVYLAMTFVFYFFPVHVFRVEDYYVRYTDMLVAKVVISMKALHRNILAPC